MPTATPARLQRDDMDLIRMRPPGLLMRAADDNAGEGDEGGMPTLYGHFLRFNEWTEIDSWYEGRFLERIAPGAAKKSIKERGARIRCLFQHGRDYIVGDKPLGVFEVLREDAEGVYYEVPLFDTGYVRELLPGLEAGAYGASFRMRVMREEWVEEPGVSDHNPDGLPERTIKEIQLFEGGPVTFGAYATATASVRSLTDHLIFDDLTRSPERMRDLVAFAERCAERSAAPEQQPADRLARAKDELRAAFESDDEEAILRAAAEITEAREAPVDRAADTTSPAGSQDSAGTESHPDTAPPDSSAATESHPADGRREHTTSTVPVGAPTRSFGALPDRSGRPTGLLPRR